MPNRALATDAQKGGVEQRKSTTQVRSQAESGIPDSMRG